MSPRTTAGSYTSDHSRVVTYTRVVTVRTDARERLGTQTLPQCARPPAHVDACAKQRARTSEPKTMLTAASVASRVARPGAKPRPRRTIGPTGDVDSVRGLKGKVRAPTRGKRAVARARGGNTATRANVFASIGAARGTVRGAGRREDAGRRARDARADASSSSGKRANGRVGGETPRASREKGGWELESSRGFDDDGARARRLGRIAALVAAALAVGAATTARASRAAAAKAAESVATPNKMEQIPGMLVVAGALLVASAFFSLAETSITTLYPWKVRELADQEGPDSVFHIMRKDITRFLTTILIGTTVAAIMSTAIVTEAALIAYGDGATTAVTAGLTVGTLLFCEIAPKSVAVQHAVSVARLVAKPVYWLSFFIYPVGRIFQLLVNGMFALLGLKATAEPFVSEEELKLVLAGATKSGEVESSEKDMIQNVLDLEETVVRDVMTPLVQVHGVRSDATLEEFRNEWIEHKYSRVPAWEDRVDNIVGIVRANRVMQLDIDNDLRPDESKPLRDILVSDVMLRDTYFVPESMSVSKLLRELMARKSHMCVVVNEFGGTVGIATLEDCMEEIVGEIYDEEDINKANSEEDEKNETPFIQEVAPNEYVVDTRAALWKLSEELHLDIPESPLYETVGGWVCDLFACIPEEGAQLCQTFDVVVDEDADSEDEGDKDGETDGLEFDSSTRRSISLTVTDSDSRRVNEVKISVVRTACSTAVDEESEVDDECALSPA